MRPSRLDSLFASLPSLPGIGPKLERLYRRLLGREETRVIDLVFHLPSGVVDRRARPKVAETTADMVATLLVTIDRHKAPPPNRSRAPYQVYAHDETGDMVLTFFHARADYLQKLLPVGETRYVSGTIAFYDGVPQMVHPDRIVTEADVGSLPLIEPVYPLTEGLGVNVVRKAVQAALGKVPELPEWQDAAWLKERRWPSFRDAIEGVHHPDDPADISPESAAWSRLAYDELLAGQLALALVRANMRRPAGQGTAGDGRLRAAITKALP